MIHGLDLDLVSLRLLRLHHDLCWLGLRLLGDIRLLLNWSRGLEHGLLHHLLGIIRLVHLLICIKGIFI